MISSLDIFNALETGDSHFVTFTLGFSSLPNFSSIRFKNGNHWPVPFGSLDFWNIPA